MTDERDDLAAYDAFMEGSRLLASSNPHAAAVALERARTLEPDKGSVREALGRAYFRSGRIPEARAPEPLDRLGGPGDGVVATPDDAVQVATDDRRP